MNAEPNAPDPTAVMVRRVVAYYIDAMIYLAGALVPLALLADSRTVVVGESLDRVGRLGGEDPYLLRGTTVYSVTNSDIITAALISLGLVLLLGVVLQGLTGRTVGKFVTGIRTVRPDGRRPGLGRALVRELSWIIDGIPSYVLPLVGGVTALATRGHRRVGDLLARTYVVHRRYAGMSIVHPDDQPTTGESGEPDGGSLITMGGADAGEPEEPTAPSPEPAPGAEAAADLPATEGGEPEQAAVVAGEDVPAATDAAPGATAVTTEPEWDAERRAYICYDHRRGEWMQHDATTGRWGPITRA